jgi:hypothetical protein
MILPEYFADVADELKRRSDRVRIGFSTHHLSAGENREEIVARFLRDYLPKAFGVETGLVLAKSGEFSNQADLLIVDHLYNAPLYPGESNRLWPVEAVYALIEAKTTLSPSDIQDAVSKCRKFKTLPRQFESVPESPRIPDSLFIIWAFEAPNPETIKRNLVAILKNIPRAEQPDFVVVPNSIVAVSGKYREISRIGMPGSQRRQQLVKELGNDLEAVLGESIEVLDLEKNALLVWLIWLTAWLKGAGHRSAPLVSYLQQGYAFGQKVS